MEEKRLREMKEGIEALRDGKVGYDEWTLGYRAACEDLAGFIGSFLLGEESV